MSKTWRTFNFAPLAVIRPQTKTGITATEYIKNLLVGFMPLANALSLYEKMINRAQQHSIRTIGDLGFNMFAVDIAYKVKAPLNAAALQYGMGLIEGENLGIDVEILRIKNIITSILNKYAPLYAKAANLVSNADLTESGEQTTTATASNETNSNLTKRENRTETYRAGYNTAVSAFPSGGASSSGDDIGKITSINSTDNTTRGKNGFLGQVDALDAYKNAMIEDVDGFIIDLIFDALFEPIEQGEKLVFGDISKEKWGV